MAYMAISPTDKELLKFISQLSLSQKDELINHVKELLKSQNNSERQSISEYNDEIDKALRDIEKGEFTSLEDLEREMESW
jgi:hypothetical protein